MSVPHHSDKQFEQQKRFIEQVLHVASPRYPRGKLYPNDEGDLAFAMAVDAKQRLIRLEFGKPVAWLAFPLEEAKELQQLLADKIRELEQASAK